VREVSSKKDTNCIAGPYTSLPKGQIDSAATTVSARSSSSPDKGHDIVSTEANLGGPSKGDFESMARRRFQDPKPRRRGNPLKLINQTALLRDPACRRVSLSQNPPFQLRFAVLKAGYLTSSEL
jgi:hypothetical protein